MIQEIKMEFSTIKTIFANTYYAVPDYQRDYEWKKEENDTLKEDLFMVTENPEEERTHFIGALVTIPYDKSCAINQSIKITDFSIDETKVRHIVDGQQRLTSLVIFIVALNKFIHNSDNNMDTRTINTADACFDRLLTGDDFDKNYTRAPRLILNGNTGAFFNSFILNMDQACNKKARGARRIKDAYELYSCSFYEKKQEMKKDGKLDQEINKFFENLVKTVCDKIRFVEIKCDASTDAFQVFDSLNGKGLDLTASDRIKNIVMSWSNGQGASSWDSILKGIQNDTYLTSFFLAKLFFEVGKRVPKNKLPEKFKEKYKDSAVKNFNSFLKTVSDEAALYREIRDNDTKFKEINKALRDIQRLGVEQIYVILFAVAVTYKDSGIKQQAYVEFLKALTKLIVKMQICERSMNRLDTTFSSCITLMKDKKPIQDVTSRILSEAKVITNDVFQNNFKNFYTSDSGVALFYLKNIEEHLRKKEGDRTPVGEDNLTIEHIIPQSIKDIIIDWYGTEPIPDDVLDNIKETVTERLGNKLLIYNDDNSSASNNNYADKIKVYKNGKNGQNNGTPFDTFILVKELLKEYPTKFNHQQVNERSQKLSEIAIEIWGD